MLSGKFVQVGPDGSRSTGAFFISKPGKVRFEYDPPSPIDCHRRRHGDRGARPASWRTRTSIPLSQTPLRFLLAATSI